VAGGQILGFSIDLLRRPYNTLALPCECAIIIIIIIIKTAVKHKIEYTYNKIRLYEITL